MEKVLKKILGKDYETSREIGLKIANYMRKHPEALHTMADSDLLSVLKTTAKQFGFIWSEISCSRKREVVEFRYLLIHAVKEKIKISNSNIGRLFGINHATVLYALRASKEWIKIYPNLKRRYESINQKFTQALDEE